MYEESGKKLSINWVSLIIKLGILAIIVFLLCWIFTRNKGNSNNYSSRDKEYIANITAMKEAAFEYFTESKLPQNIGGTKTLSLNDMVNQKLLIDFTNNGKDCNLSNSYVQTTKTADGAYALKVNLVCGDTNDFIVTTIEEPKCPNNDCLADNTTDKEEDNNVNPDYLPDENDKYYDDKTDSYVNNNQQNNTTNNNANTNNSTSQNKSPKVVTKVKITISACNTCNNNGTNNNTNNNNENNKPSETPKTKYYRYYRYTDWQNGYSSDANAEVQKCELKTYDYCKINNQTIYTTSYTQNANPHSYSYTLKFTDFTANDIMDGTIKVVPNSEQHFGNSILDYSNYVDMKYNKPNISMVGDTSGKNNSDSTTVDLGKFRESSLKSSNFTFDVSEVYKKNNDYYVDINIHIKNVNGVKAYYDNTLGFSLYYVPLKFNITYVNKNQCITDYEEYSSKYSNGYIAINPQTKTSYRYRLKEFIWSTDANLDGWTFTGKVEYY